MSEADIILEHIPLTDEYKTYANYIACDYIKQDVKDEMEAIQKVVFDEVIRKVLGE